MEELIKDDGVIRKCPSNMAKMGYIKSYREFFGYKDSIKEYPFRDVLLQLLEALRDTFGAVVYLIIFPIVPFLRCYFTVKRAKKEVAKENKLKGER